MIVYELTPIPLPDQSRLKAWFDTKDAQLFRECVVSEMNKHYCDAINLQQQADSSDDEADARKFEHQGKAHSNEAKRYRVFLAVLDHIASERHQFHKLKITT